MVYHDEYGCTERGCDYCEARAERRKAEREEPLSDAESARLDNAYEQSMWGDQ